MLVSCGGRLTDAVIPIYYALVYPWSRGLELRSWRTMLWYEIVHAMTILF